MKHDSSTCQSIPSCTLDPPSMIHSTLVHCSASDRSLKPTAFFHDGKLQLRCGLPRTSDIVYTTGRSSFSERSIPTQPQQQPTLLPQPSIGMAQATFQCPICKGIFPLRKTLNRHLRTVHQPSKIRCRHCALEFNRKDIKDRHELEQHGTSSDAVECSICHVQVRQRALSSHFNSKRHGRAQKQADEIHLTLSKVGRGLRASRIPDTEALIDPTLVTTCLIVKLLARFSGLLWPLCVDTIKQSFEMLKLKGQALRSISKMIERRPLPKSTEFMAPVATMAIVQWIFGELEQAELHIKVLVSLYGSGPDSIQVDWATPSCIASPSASMHLYMSDGFKRVGLLVSLSQVYGRLQRQETPERTIIAETIQRAVGESLLKLVLYDSALKRAKLESSSTSPQRLTFGAGKRHPPRNVQIFDKQSRPFTYPRSVS